MTRKQKAFVRNIDWRTYGAVALLAALFIMTGFGN